jgi:phosphoglycolate phosphatase
MKYRFLFFDLDGTLLNTLDDLRDAVNTILVRYQMPEITPEQTAAFVGNGAGHLIHCAVPEGTPEEQEKKILAEYRQYYQEHCQVRTAPYSGIPEMLERLKEAGCVMAVVSNKPDAAVKELNRHFFKGLLDSAIGESAEIRRKPAPDTVFEAMRQTGAEQSSSVYIGDSEVDIETARNAGLPCISVSWGFRNKQELEAAGAQVIAGNAEELEQLLMQEK